MKSIYFIAVNYNNAAYSIQYVESILAMKGNQNRKIIIVDNKSNAADVRFLEERIKKHAEVTLIKNDTNAGYFRGLNAGLKTINPKDADFVFIGNNDLTFEPEFIQNLYQQNYSDQTFAIAPDVVTANGFHQNPLCTKRMHPLRKWGLRLYYTNYFFGKTIYHLTQVIKKATIPNKKLLTPSYIYMGIGACYILTPHFFKAYKLLREDVFLWSEEALFAGQITEAGGKTWYCPDLIVHHAENTSIKHIPSRLTYRMARESFLKTFRYY